MNSFHRWIPEDDFLLKNAVEAGASLESLAKGAVSFSRRYSVRELRDRWRSLLYDPGVAYVASSAMARLEIAKTNGNGNKEGATSGDSAAARKRKAQTICKKYYAMRRRLHTEVFFDKFDMAMQDEMCLDNNNGGKEIGVSVLGNINGHLDKSVNNSLLNSLVNFGNSLGLVEGGAGSSHSMSEDSLWKTIEDVSAPNMPVHVKLENENSESKEMVPSVPDAAVMADAGTEISDALLDLPNGDELMFMNIGEKDETATDKQCCDNNVDSLLLGSPCDVEGNDESGVREPEKLVAEAQLALSRSGSSAELEVGANSIGSSHGDSGFISDCGHEVESSAAARTSLPKLCDDFKFCSLNTEDPNVPLNDVEAVNISTVVPNTVTPKPISIVKEVGYPDSFISDQTKNGTDGSLKKKDIPSNSFAAAQTVQPGLVPNINSSKENPVDNVPKTENPANNPISAVSRQSNKVVAEINQNQSRSVHATMKHASDGRPIQEVIIALPSVVNPHQKVSEHKTLSDFEAKLLCINQERADDYDDSDDNADYDDNEIPFFSDAEAMILEMDLGPTDQDANASTEVLKFQNERTKRTILRLEQCAQSFIRRAIASRGAFAALYGRTMKKYIKKTEVVLGRSTDDVKVDIDLGREAEAQYATKISRRQALIKMKANGSFVIRNLGKSPIYLNGKEIAQGQKRSLIAGNLIEIRSLAFIFEVNNKCVKRFIENMNEQ
ncbi:uncharacterized protein [Cicer arietinum]|uniref:Uncharacterized protein LOC101512131 n=1 Tax=Cicer arietinum TaxID=3827 RepID=A0A1S2YSS3_CICAR|nr:uncharacterized protein LOC101512131 [Cicer arietinum]